MSLKCLVSILILQFVALTASAQPLPNLPEPVSNNAVASVTLDGKQHLISFMGLAQGKTWKDVHNKVWSLKVGDEQWHARQPVPASLALAGRLASVAVGIGEDAFLFGGYTVAEDHSEISSPDNFRYRLRDDSYHPIAPMPVAVDDAVALVYQNKFIYLLSGWHNDGNVNLVQLYDIANDRWQQATPYPGAAVFGHAGGIVDNKMVVCDGVKVDTRADRRRTFAPAPGCFLGSINPDNPTRIDWRTLLHPTGTARYRMAAAGIADKNHIVFFGGSENPYNYNGIGYNGEPSVADSKVWLFNLAKQQWQINNSPSATMDHRGLLQVGGSLLVIGGMKKQQQVTSDVTTLPIPF